MRNRLYTLLLAVLTLALSTACNTTTEINEDNVDKIDPIDLIGFWRTTNGAEFNMLALFADNTFIYAENDLSVMSPDENGLEAGTYSFDAATGNLSFNVTYDDNDPGNDSGVGDIGIPVAYDVVLSNERKTLSLASGALVLSREEVGSSPILGVWRITNGVEFSILALLVHNTFMYAENDTSITSPDENGLEVGMYNYDSMLDSLSFDIIYDDNDPGNDSGVGNIGTTVIVEAILSNGNTNLTVAGGILVFTKEF